MVYPLFPRFASHAMRARRPIDPTMATQHPQNGMVTSGTRRCATVTPVPLKGSPRMAARIALTPSLMPVE